MFPAISHMDLDMFSEEFEFSVSMFAKVRGFRFQFCGRTETALASVELRIFAEPCRRQDPSGTFGRKLPRYGSRKIVDDLSQPLCQLLCGLLIPPGKEWRKRERGAIRVA